MTGREAPVRARKPKQSAEARGPDAPPASAQAGRRLGAAAQLTAVHHMLRHGPALQLEAGAAAGANRTGLPDRLKSGIETLSGVSLDGVKVHYNSSRPAQLHAQAYAQGGDIHLGPGQERHLPHEAWHVVQQAQGRVKPTLRTGDAVAVNNDAALELEADAMGDKASRASSKGDLALQNIQMHAATRQMMGWTRWYEYDGKDYIPRFVGTYDPRWIPMGEHEGKPAYISVENLSKLPDVKALQDNIGELKKTVDQYTPLISAVKDKVAQQDVLILDLEEARDKFITMEAAVGNYLKNTSTFLKVVAALFGFTAAVTGGMILSYVTLPQWAVATIEGLSFLYGVGLLYRWLKSELLPTIVKAPLVTLNALIMVTSTSITLSQIAAYYSGLTETIPLQHIQFAAIPMALLLEHFIVAVLEKINAFRKLQNERAGHDPDKSE